MARINIENSFFNDQRWMNLISKTGDSYRALGLVTAAWVLAQKNWLQYKHIPKKAWPKELDILIDVELATRRADGNIYIKGSKKAFLWLEQKVEAGRKGGLTSRRTKKDPNEIESNPGEAAAKHTLTPAKREEAAGNPPFSFLLSPSSKEEKNTSDQDRTSLLNKKELDEALETIYKSFPRKEGKTPGMKIAKKEIKTGEQLQQLQQAVINYSNKKKGTDSKFLLLFSTFMNQWRDWLDSSTGSVDNNFANSQPQGVNFNL